MFQDFFFALTAVEKDASQSKIEQTIA